MVLDEAQAIKNVLS